MASESVKKDQETEFDRVYTEGIKEASYAEGMRSDCSVVKEGRTEFLGFIISVSQELVNKLYCWLLDSGCGDEHEEGEKHQPVVEEEAAE